MQVSKVGQLPKRNILNIFLGKQNSKSFPQRFLCFSDPSIILFFVHKNFTSFFRE